MPIPQEIPRILEFEKVSNSVLEDPNRAPHNDNVDSVSFISSQFRINIHFIGFIPTSPSLPVKKDSKMTAHHCKQQIRFGKHAKQIVNQGTAFP
ncbi:MAG: hypothetical protein CMJ78_23390 [Planctomycetaceae bacterium]|nr:hypothetical protein [Planctomycetaceae bacterium]